MDHVTKKLAAVLAGLVLGVALAAGASDGPPAAGFENARIAEYGLAAFGRYAGQCRGAVIRWVLEASDGRLHLGGGYYSGYQAAGGRLIRRDASREGDIIQITNPRHPDKYAPGVHTAVVLAHAAGLRDFAVVDSNRCGNGVVDVHRWNPYAAAARTGNIVHIWRLGVVPPDQPRPLKPLGRFREPPP